MELATRMDRGRFRPVVYSLAAAPAAGEDWCLETLRAAGITVHCLGAGRTWQFPAIVRRLEKLLREQSPQLVQTFLFHANIIGRIAARRAGVPRVVSGIRVAQRRPRWRLWLDRATDRWVDRHVCVSQAVAQFSAHEGRLPAGKLVVIPNGVDVARFPASAAMGQGRARGTVPRPEVVPAGREAIVCIGRLERQKGLAWLLETAAIWMPQVPQCDLLLAGRGPQQSLLEAQCRTLGLRDRVHFLGWRPDIVEILAASRLLVLPSQWEGMPNVVLEAMAAGLPVVATDVEGVRELLGPAATAQVCAAG